MFPVVMPITRGVTFSVTSSGDTAAGNSPVINWDFLQSQSLTSFSRTSNATLFDSTGKLTYAPNNLLLNTATLSTQTVTTGLQAGVSVILSFSGTGSVAISGGYTGSLAGTGVSDRVSLKFTTTTNSLTFTVTGSVTSAQLEVVTYQPTPGTYTATTSSQYYGPRYPYAYNGTTWDAQGLLVEAQSINKLPYSNNFASTGWTTANTSAPVQGATSPDGTTNAWTLSETAATGVHELYFNAISTTPEPPYSWSIYAKAGTARYFCLWVSSGAVVKFDLQTGTVLGPIVGTGSGDTVSGEIYSVGNGWYRLVYHSTRTAAQYIGVPGMGFSNNGNITSGSYNVYAGNTGNNVLIAFAQFEAGDLSSYIPNLATGTTTRNADTSLAFSAISLPTGLSFSRASNAMQYDAAGRLTYAPHNLLGYSNTLNDVTWTYGNMSAPTQNAAGYDGVASTAWTATAKSGTSTRSFGYQTLTASSVTNTFSLYAKKGTWNFIYLNIQSASANNWITAVFNLDAGTVTQSSAGSSSGTIVATSITSAGNGFYRISITGYLTSATIPLWGFANAAAGNSLDTYGQIVAASWAGTETVIVQNAQLEDVTYETVARPYVANSTANAVYGPRYDYDPLTRLPKGLLIEEGRTNVIADSGNINSGNWSEFRAVRSNDGTKAPDNAGSFIKITAAAASDTQIIYQSRTLTANTTYTMSVYVKYSNTRYVSLLWQGNTANRWAAAVFDIGSTSNTAATQTAFGSSSGTITSTSQQYIGNGIFRLSLTASVNDTGVYFICQFAGAATGNTFTGAGYINVTTAGTEAFYLWGAQLEAGSFPTSYIPNPGIASGIRSADIATLTGTASTIASASDGTMVIETDAMQTGSTDQILFGNLLKDQLYRMGVGGNLNKVSNYQFRTAGTSTTNTATWTAPVRASVAYSANAISVCLQGGAVATGTGNLTMSGSTYVGSDGSGTQVINGYVRKVGMWNVRLADAKLQQKSVVGATL